MFQCLVCEDWLHESCTSLRPSKQGDDINNADRQLADGPLVDHESFDLFICSECSRKPGNEVLQQYLGRKGWIVCLREGEEDVKNIRSINVEAVGTDWTEKWKVYGLIGEEGSGNVSIADTSTSIKRKADDEASQEDVVKKVKVQDGESEGEAAKEEQESFVSIARSEYLEACTKPEPALSTGSLSSSARFDVFLAENFREQVCRCKGVSENTLFFRILDKLMTYLQKCITEMSAFPYIAEPEETYSPPQSVQDNDDANSEGGASQTSSSYDLGLAALQRLPRAQMMESLDQYNKMRDALFNHLRPFAESGRVVDGESLREFFRKQREDHH
jgi:E3 ubiquitin-protein ligase UBR7